MNRARKAGASSGQDGLTRLLCALLLGIAAGAAAAADVTLRHVDVGMVRAAPIDGGGRLLETGPLRLGIATGSGEVVLELRPHPALGAFGSSEGRAVAYTGTLPGRQGSWAALTRTPRGWSGIWFDGNEFYGIEPAAGLAETRHQALAGAAPGQPMVFKLSDVVWDEDSFDNDFMHAPPGNAKELLGLLAEAVPGDGPTHRLELAMVADAYLAAREGEDLEAYLLAQLNIIDGVFRNQVGLEVAAHSITLFTRPEQDPFSQTNDASQLLDELSAWRIGNPWQRQTALTHLFTGRDLERRTVGLAYLDTLCNRRYSASLSESRSAASFAALIAAHEIAHVLGAPHDGDREGACADVTGNFLMAPRINGSQQLSACSIAQILPRIEAASCLVRLAPASGNPPSAPVDSGGGGGGGALAVTALVLLGLWVLCRVCRRAPQIRANQSAR